MKIIRASPHADDEADLVDALVHGWCAFDGAPEDVWSSFGDERKDVEETKGSALEVCLPGCFRQCRLEDLIKLTTSQARYSFSI